MADIFLSYNEKDRPLVRQLAQALERAGWSVWWDRRVPAGMTWRSLLEQELQNMRCMLVLWSANSVKSEWVCEEATEGRLLGRLIPVFIERVRPPAGFREVQAADLVDWDGSKDFIGLQQLLADIAHKLGTPTEVPKDLAPPAVMDEPQPRPVRWKTGGVAAALLLVAMGVYVGIAAVARRETVATVAPPPTTSTPSATVIAEPAASVPAPLSATSTLNAAMAAAAVPTLLPSVNTPPKLVLMPAPITDAVLRKRLASLRCDGISARQGLGETLSAPDQAFLEKEC